MFIELYSMLNIQPKDKAFKLAKGRLLSRCMVVGGQLNDTHPLAIRLFVETLSNNMVYK